MPTYVYKCEECGDEVEANQGFDDDPLEICGSCGGQLKRLIQPNAVIFKGSGFYNTDHRPDTRVHGESGKLGRRVSETDESNIDSETPTRVDATGKPHITPTRPGPVDMPA